MNSEVSMIHSVTLPPKMLILSYRCWAFLMLHSNLGTPAIQRERTGRAEAEGGARLVRRLAVHLSWLLITCQIDQDEARSGGDLGSVWFVCSLTRTKR